MCKIYFWYFCQKIKFLYIFLFLLFSHNFLAVPTLLIPYICCVYFPHFISTSHCCKYPTFRFHFTLLQISHISFPLHIVANIPHFVSTSHCCIYCLSFLSGKFPMKKEAPYGKSVSEPFFHKVLLQFTSCFSSYSGLQPSKSLSSNKS